MQQLRGTGLKRLHRGWKRSSAVRMALLLEGVQSPFNVGAIVRTASALGVAELFLVGRTASPRSSRAQKLAMGTDRYLEVHEFADLSPALAEVTDRDYRLVGLELADEAVPLHEVDLTADTCLAIGAEDHGLSAACMSACDTVAFIPQLGRVGSLNVATAASMACYELRRQDWLTVR